MTSYIEAVEKMIDQHNTLPIRIKELEDRNKELTLQLLATSGQAADALDRAVVAEAKLAKAMEIGNEMAKSIAGNYYLPNAATRWFYMMVELADEPLGAEFAAVWDANKGALYEA